MKYLFVAFITCVVFGIGFWFYLSQTYPQTSPAKSAVYYAESIVKPHKKLEKHTLGFIPFWQLENSHYIRPELLSEINYFSITADSEGHIIQDTSEPGWRGFQEQTTRDLITEARIKGTDITVTIAVLDVATIESILSSEEAQTTLTSQLIQLIQNNNLNGVNIDFEYIDIPENEIKGQFTDFSKQLRTAMGEQTPEASLSISLMPRAVRDPDIYEFDKLAQIYDRFIGMSYEYYPGTAEISAPVAPMRGFKDNKYFFDVETTYEDYASVLPKEKLIMGIPYYGWERAVEDGPTINSPTFPGDHPDNYAAVISYGRARESKEINKKQCQWDEYAMETWCWFTDKESGVDRQVWLADNKSIEVRFDFANKQNLGGIAIWTLGYDKQYNDLWDLLGAKFSKSN